MCFNNYPFCSQLLCFNDYYVIHIANILMLVFCKIIKTRGLYESMTHIVKECTNDVCGMSRMGRQSRKGSENVGVTVAEKRRAFVV